MRRFAGLAAGLVLTTASAGAEPFEETLTVSGPSLYVEDLIGAVRIEPAPGSAFEVLVQVRGKDASRQNVRIEQKDRNGDGAGIRVVFPIEDASRFVYPPLGPRSRSTFQWGQDSKERRSFWRDVFNLGPGKRVTISGDGDGLEIWADLTIRVPRGRRLALKLGVGGAEAAGVDGDLNLDTASGSVQAERLSGKVLVDTGSGEVVLRGMKGNAVIDTGSGHVTAEDVEGDLHVDTGSGHVEIARVHGRKILADTGSGRVTLSDVSCEDLSVDTGSGGIEAAGVDAGGALFDTGSGGVEVTFTRLGKGRVEIDSGSGGVTLVLPPSPSATVQASTGSGSVHVDLEGVDWIHKARDETTFRVGSGESRILIGTGSGSIRIRS